MGAGGRAASGCKTCVSAHKFPVARARTQRCRKWAPPVNLVSSTSGRGRYFICKARGCGPVCTRILRANSRPLPGTGLVCLPAPCSATLPSNSRWRTPSPPSPRPPHGSSWALASSGWAPRPGNGAGTIDHSTRESPHSRQVPPVARDAGRVRVPLGLRRHFRGRFETKGRVRAQCARLLRVTPTARRAVPAGSPPGPRVAPRRAPRRDERVTAYLRRRTEVQEWGSEHAAG